MGLTTMNTAVYKVLWVDDEKDIVQGYQLLAGIRNIQLIHFENWMAALPMLEKEFDELTAIILDANCKWDDKELAPSEFFLGNVLSSLMRLFGERHYEIPWYILSAGTMTNFDTITNVLINGERRSHEKDWGKTVFLKTDFQNQGENNPLFDCIRCVGDNYSNNIVLYRHRETFNYLGADALICDDARKIMLKALAVLYYPEENINYEFAGNPIRKIVEYMFKSAFKYGLLTDVFLDDRGNIRIADSMQYLCGMDPSQKSNIRFRFGKKGTKNDYSDYESVFPTSCYNAFRGLLNYVNVDSHTIEEGSASPYRIDAESKDLFFSYVLLLCHLIICFGKYVEQHPNVEENRKKCAPIHDRKTTKESQETKPAVEFVLRVQPEEFIGQQFTVLQEKTFKYVGACKISPDIRVNLLARVRIEEVIPNTDKDNAKYPYIATKITIL